MIVNSLVPSAFRWASAKVRAGGEAAGCGAGPAELLGPLIIEVFEAASPSVAGSGGGPAHNLDDRLGIADSVVESTVVMCWRVVSNAGLSKTRMDDVSYSMQLASRM